MLRFSRGDFPCGHAISTQGKAAVSGYSCKLMDQLYGDWTRIDAPEKLCHSTKDMRQEALWINCDRPDGLLDSVA